MSDDAIAGRAHMAVAHRQHKAEKPQSSVSQPIESSADVELSWAGLLTMPNPAKQLERHSWVAGYADGYIDGLEEAWARINAAIERGPMPQREKDGLLFACKLIASPSR